MHPLLLPQIAQDPQIHLPLLIAQFLEDHNTVNKHFNISESHTSAEHQLSTVMSHKSVISMHYQTNGRTTGAHHFGRSLQTRSCC
jgi:hypothetical protein